MVQGLNPQQLQQVLTNPQLMQQVSQHMEVKAPNEQTLAKQAFTQLLQSMDHIPPNSISLFTTDKQSGSVGIIQGANMVRAFVSTKDTDKLGYKRAEVVDFERDADGQGVQVKARETSAEGGALVDEKAVDAVVLNAIIKHVQPNAQVKSLPMPTAAAQPGAAPGDLATPGQDSATAVTDEADATAGQTVDKKATSAGSGASVSSFVKAQKN
jgi:hypothetical protein